MAAGWARSIQGSDSVYINPKYRDQYEASRGPAPEPPQETGERLATCPRNRDGVAEELRVTLREYQGNPYVGLWLWERNQAGQWWPVRGKGVSVRLNEAASVAKALMAALRRAEGESGQAMGQAAGQPASRPPRSKYRGHVPPRKRAQWEGNLPEAGSGPSGEFDEF